MASARRAALTAAEERVSRMFPHPLLWGGLGLVIAADTALAWWLGIRVVIDDKARLMLMLIAGLAGLSLLLNRRGMDKAAVMFAAVAFFGLFGLAGSTLNYLTVALGRPLIDAKLAAIDAWLGFDWMGYFAFTGAHPMWGQLLSWAYQSFFALFPLTLVWLIITGRTARLRMFAFLYVFTALACVLIGGAFPALGAFAHYQPAPELHAQVPLAGEGPYLAQMIGFHGGTMKELVLSKLEGIVTFPSFHTVMALMFAWAFRGTILQWPMYAWSALTIASTPVIGHHYAIDIIGGVAVFALVLWALKRLEPARAGMAAAHPGRRRLPQPAE